MIPVPVSSFGVRTGMAGSYGDPWDDLMGDVSQGVASSTLTYEAFRDTPWLAYFFRHDQQDALSFRLQLPHRWKPGTQVSFHLHLVPMVNPSSDQVVKIKGQYAWISDQGALPANASWTTFDVAHTVANGDAFKQFVVNLFDSTPDESTYKESSVLCVYVYRDGSDVADTFTTSKASGTAAANLMLLSADAHFRFAKEGTPAKNPRSTTPE